MSLNHYLTRLIWVCVLPLVLFSVYLAVQHIHTLQEQQDREAAHRVHNVATALDHDLEARISALQVLAASPLMDDPHRLQEYYQEAQSFHENFGGGVILADLSMQMLFNTRVPFGSVLPQLPRPKGHAAVPVVLANGKPAVGDMFFGPVAKEPLVAVVAPVIRNGRIKLLLLNTFETRVFQQRLSKEALPAGWRLTLLDSNNVALARRAPPELVQRPVDMKSPGLFVAKLAVSPWSVVLEIPQDAYRKPFVLAATALVVAILTFTLISVLVGRLASRGLARSMATLSASSPLDSAAPGILEIETVRATLEAAVVAIREAQERPRRFIDANIIGVVIASPAGAIIEANDYYLHIIGYTREEFEQGMVDWRSITPPEWLPADERAIEELRELGTCTPYEKEYVRRDGSRVAVFLTDALLPGPDEHIAAFVLDITERRQAEEKIRKLNTELEERVRERTNQLESLNKELEAFSYSVSHDLKAPLRGIDGYSQLLEREYSDRLDEEGRLFIRNIRHGTAQMHELIEDVLAYSRMERRTMQSTSLDLAALVQTAVAERAAEIAQTGTQMHVEVPALCVRADRDGLAVVLRNLLENALKFSRNAQPPMVEIGARIEGGRAILWVRDNGIGFDMKFLDRIFEIFQRLERSEDYPGTGVGLALVRKAMVRMGGRVWAESTPGKGATFFLEVPQ